MRQGRNLLTAVLAQKWPAGLIAVAHCVLARTTPSLPEYLGLDPSFVWRRAAFAQMVTTLAAGRALDWIGWRKAPMRLAERQTPADVPAMSWVGWRVSGAQSLRLQATEISFATLVTPGAAHAVSAATRRSCQDVTTPVNRTSPSCALTVILCGSKNHERCNACMILSTIFVVLTRGLMIT